MRYVSMCAPVLDRSMHGSMDTPASSFQATLTLTSHMQMHPTQRSQVDHDAESTRVELPRRELQCPVPPRAPLTLTHAHARRGEMPIASDEMPIASGELPVRQQSTVVMASPLRIVGRAQKRARACTAAPRLIVCIRASPECVPLTGARASQGVATKLPMQTTPMSMPAVMATSIQRGATSSVPPFMTNRKGSMQSQT